MTDRLEKICKISHKEAIELEKIRGTSSNVKPIYTEYAICAELTEDMIKKTLGPQKQPSSLAKIKAEQKRFNKDLEDIECQNSKRSQ